MTAGPDEPAVPSEAAPTTELPHGVAPGTAAPGNVRPVALWVPFRTMMAVAVFAAIVTFAIIAAGTFLSIFVAVVLALGLDPVVSALVRRGWGRGKAALATFAGLFTFVFILIIGTAAPLWSQIVEFVEEIPVYWDEITSLPAFQDIVSSGDADARIRKGLEQLAAGLPDAASAIAGVAGGVVGSALSGVTLAFLALFLLMERPTITNWLWGFTPPEVEDRWEPVLEESIKTVSSTLIGNVAISLVAGTITFVAATLLDMPFPIVLAVMTGLLDLIPQVGATVAAIILVMIALTVSTEAAVIMAVVQLVYQQVENYVIYPIVYRKAVELSGFTTIVAVLISSAVLGVIGAILAVPFAAVIKVVLHEWTRPRRERMAALREARGKPAAAGASADAT